MFGDTIGSLKRELLEIRQEKQALRLPAYLWERHSPSCTGNCAEPKPVAIDISGIFFLDCCSFYVAMRLYSMLRGTETMLQNRLKEVA